MKNWLIRLGSNCTGSKLGESSSKQRWMQCRKREREMLVIRCERHKKPKKYCVHNRRGKLYNQRGKFMLSITQLELLYWLYFCPIYVVILVVAGIYDTDIFFRFLYIWIDSLWMLQKYELHFGKVRRLREVFSEQRFSLFNYDPKAFGCISAALRIKIWLANF